MQNICLLKLTNQVLLLLQGFEFLHMWWIFVVSLPVMSYLLWMELGPSCLVGISLIIIQPPLQYALGRLHTSLWYVIIWLHQSTYISIGNTTIFGSCGFQFIPKWQGTASNWWGPGPTRPARISSYNYNRSKFLDTTVK